MMSRDFQTNLLVCGLIALTILLTFEDVCAQPKAKLIVYPSDMRTLDISSPPQKIEVIARVNQEGVQFTWKHDGPGRIEGDITSREIIYIPPGTINGESAKVTISVTATDPQGRTATDRVTLTLVASSEPLVASPEPLSSRIALLLQKAETYFQQKSFIAPKDQNVFDTCKSVLRIDPYNTDAWEKMRQITELFYEWGKEAYNQQQYSKAHQYYQNYLLLARYTLNRREAQYIKIDEVQQHLKELETFIVSSANSQLEGAAKTRKIVYRPSLPQVTVDVEVEIKLKFWVLPDGTIGEVIPIKRGDLKLERIAIAYLKKWQFEPLPPQVPQQKIWGTIPIKFTLR